MIKFPQVHIATSVVNRILNVADGLPKNQAPAFPNIPPGGVPDTSTQSANIDAGLAEPGIAGLPGLDQAPDPGATVAGKPLMATLLEPK